MIAGSVLDLIGDTPLIRLQGRQRGDRLRDPRQGGVPEPRPVGEGPRGAVHHPRRRAARDAASPAGGSSRAPPATPASAWPWSPARSATAHHRHPAHPEPGEEGRHPPDGRRARRGGRRPLLQPRQLRALFRPPGRGTGRQGAGRRDLGQPVRQRRQPPGPRRGHRPGDLGADRTAGSTASSARSAPAARWPASPTALRAQKPDVAIGLADPGGAALYDYYAHGELKAEGTSISEGIGQGRITANLEGLVVDYPYRVSRRGDDARDHRARRRGPGDGRLDRDQRRRRGPAWRASSGPGHTIVTILADYGSRYQSKLFNPAFLKERGLPVPPWLRASMSGPAGLDRLARRASGRAPASWCSTAAGTCRPTARDAEGRVRARPHPRRGLLRHRRGLRPRQRPAAHAAAAGRTSRRRRGGWASSRARRSSSTTAVGVFSAPRVWWSFRAMGHDQVFVLDGGLKKWIAEGHPVEAGWREPAHGEFKAHFRPELVARPRRGARGAGRAARRRWSTPAPAARFRGEAPEPRPGPARRPHAGRAQRALVAAWSPTTARWQRRAR